MRVKGWDPMVIKDLAETATKAKFDEAAQTVARAIRTRTTVGTVSRPIYRRGPYAGQWWTARDGGALKRSVRTVRREDQFGVLAAKLDAANVRVYIGSKKAYYARIIEHATPFIRPALDASLGAVKRILGAR